MSETAASPSATSGGTGDDPAAPILDYGLPVATEFEVRGFIDLGLPAEAFVEAVRRPKRAQPAEVHIVTTATRPTATAVAGEHPVPVVVAQPVGPDDGRWQPHEAAFALDEVNTRFTLQTLAAGAAGGGTAGRLRPDAAPGERSAEGAPVAPAVPDTTARSGTFRAAAAMVALESKYAALASAGVGAIALAAPDRAFNLALRRDMYGGLAQVAVASVDQARPRLHIVEHYRLASYLGDYGAANTVGTFTLLPGERTTITISTSVKAETSRDVTSNVLDSFNEQSSAEFERQLSDQRTLGYNATDQSASSNVTSEATQMSAGASVHGGVNLGIVSFGGGISGSIANQTSEVDSTSSNSTRQQSVNDVRSALDHHVNQSSSARNRQVSAGTRDTSSLTTEAGNVEVRQIENINRSRVLNFVVRQLVQSYHTVTYLREVSFLFENGFPEDFATAKLDSLNDLVAQVIVPERRAAVLGRIMHVLYNVRDHEDRLRQLVEPVPADAWNVPPGLPAVPDEGGLPRFRRRPSRAFTEAPAAGGAPIGAALTIGGQEVVVNGVVLDVATRVLRTNNVITDALLGRGEALDAYNVDLQAAAVRKEELGNDRVEAGIEALAGTDPAARPGAYAEMFNPRILQDAVS